MSKTYTEQLAEWAKAKGRSRGRNTNLVLFLALKKDIEAALSQGYQVKIIWEHLHETGKIHCRYETFLGYVHRHCSTLKARTARKEILSAEPVSPKKTKEPIVAKAEMPGFHFNPVPNKKELV